VIKRDKYTRIMRCSPNARVGNHARDLHRPLLSSSSLAHFARIDGHQRVLTFTFSLMRRKRTPLGNEQTMSAKKREQRDPADFDYDYDRLREHLMQEGNRGPIAFVLNFFAENAFGDFVRERTDSKKIGLMRIFAVSYRAFLEKLPYKRQQEKKAGQAKSRTTIRDESDRRLEDIVSRIDSGRDAGLVGDVRRLKTFWLASRETMKDKYAENLAMRTLSLAEMVGSSTTKEDQDEVCARVNEIAKALTCTPREAVDACHVEPEALSTSSYQFVQRMNKLKIIAPRANCCAMFLTAPRLFMGEKGDQNVAIVSQNAKILKSSFPNVDVDALIEHDPELLIITDLNEAIKELLSLWSEEAFALSDSDNDFFAEELAVALRACSSQKGSLPEQFS